MKSKITYALKTVFLFILFLGLINCEEEAIEDSVSVIAEPEFSIQEKSFIELSSDSNFIANIDHLKSIKEEVKKDLSANKEKKKELYNFTIDSSIVKVIKHRKRTSYTFAVKRDYSTDYIENLVLEKNRKDKVKKAFLIRYYPDTYPKFHKEHNSYSITGKRKIVKLNPKHSSLAANQECYTVGEWWCNWGEEHHLAGDRCFQATDDRVYFKEKTECYNIPDDGGAGNTGGSGGGDSNTNPPLGPGPDIITGLVYEDSETQEKVNDFVETLNSIERGFLNHRSNGEFKGDVVTHLFVNNFSEEAEAFAKEAIKVQQVSTIPEEKAVVSALLNGDLDTATDILLEGATYTNSQCPPDCNDVYFDAPVDLTASIIIGTSDGVNNTLLLLEEFLVGGFEFHRRSRGKTIKRIIKESGIDIPNDVDLLVLDRLFKLRMRGAQMVVEQANEDIFDVFNDLAISMLDITSIISPGSGGGAYLFVKAGGNITVKALADYFKILNKGNWKTVNESMSDDAKSYQEFISGKAWNQSFELNNMKFDAIKKGILADAKSAGFINFVDQSTGQFKAFFLNSTTGGKALIKQAERQLSAAEGLPVVWHFENKIVRDAVEHLFLNKNFTKLTLKYTPKP